MQGGSLGPILSLPSFSEVLGSASPGGGEVDCGPPGPHPCLGRGCRGADHVRSPESEQKMGPPMVGKLRLGDGVWEKGSIPTRRSWVQGWRVSEDVELSGSRFFPRPRPQRKEAR